MMPLLTATPSQLSKLKRTTAASCGAWPVAPISGFTMVRPFTSWSYCRMTDSREQMLREASSNWSRVGV